MTKNIALFAIVSVGIIGLAGCSSTIEKVQSSNVQQEPVKEVVVENGQAPVFTSFTQERYSEFLGKKPFAIFFHANWCSTCTQLTAAINRDLANFPKGTVILEADFDTETKLKQNYGIVMQATIVVIDETGKVVQKLAAPSAEQLKKAIAQTL
ncbi:MAG: thioredoxin family protein [Patescibacteria group bacterium]